MSGRARITEERRIFNETLGRRLARARLGRDKTAVALAKAAGISRSALSNYESGQRECPLGVARRLADLLEISTEELIPRFPGAARKAAPKRGNCLNETSS